MGKFQFKNKKYKSYDQYEKDRETTGSCSYEPGSVGMIELNSRLKKENDDLKKTQKGLEAFFENIDEVLYSVDMVSYKLIKLRSFEIK